MPVFFPPGMKTEINVTEDFLAFNAVTACSLINSADVAFVLHGEGVSQNQPAQLNGEPGQTLATTTHFRAQQVSWC